MSQKLTPEELQEFQSYRQESNRLAAILGELSYRRTLIEFELDGVKDAIKANAQKQNEQLRALGSKYGDGSINVETGDISPVEPS